MTKGPTLLAIDCKSGEVRRYLRRYRYYPESHWRVEVTHRGRGVDSGEFGCPEGLAILERFRTTGALA